MPERLTTDSTDDFWPAPSPDGRGGRVPLVARRIARRLGPAARRRPAPAGDLLAGLRRRWPSGGRPTGTVSPTPIFAGQGRHHGRCAAREPGSGSSRSSGSAGGSSPAGRPTAAPWHSAARMTRGALWIMPADSGPPRLAGRHHRASGGAGRSGRGGATTAAPSTPAAPTPPAARASGAYRSAAARPSGWWRSQGGQRSSGGWGAAAGRLAYTSVGSAQRRVGDGRQERRTPTVRIGGARLLTPHARGLPPFDHLTGGPRLARRPAQRRFHFLPAARRG